MNVKAYGQFITTNYKYILNNFDIPKNVETIIEPFCGDGDLLKFCDSKYKFECYDMFPKNDFTIKQDTILNPPDYTDKFVLTNPPYLAQNKSKNKIYFEKYNQNDLYKCFIKELINQNPQGGILIIPLNFFCSILKPDIQLRKDFLTKYNILLINIFEEKVFKDTSYTICSLLFEKRKCNNKTYPTIVYPSPKKLMLELNETNNYTIGGEIYQLKTNKKWNISRLTKKNINDKNTNLIIKCIDDNMNSKINLKYNENDVYIDKTENSSARSYASLIITPKINIETQKQLAIKFNNFIEKYRTKYNSLFLTNYRENGRKRISFSLVYKIIQYILENNDANV
jgi:hypothetical protein